MAKCVLIVDDSSIIRQALRRLFTSEPGFDKFGEAANGREAISMARELHPDLIVIDLSMPIMNGLEATRILRKLLPRVPIIMYSAYSDGLIEEEAREAGVSTLISKSDHISTLLARARNLCMGKAA